RHAHKNRGDFENRCFAGQRESHHHRRPGLYRPPRRHCCSSHRHSQTPLMRIVLLKPGDEQLLCDAEAVFYGAKALSRQPPAMLFRLPEFVMVAALDDDGPPMGRIYGHILHRWETSELLLYEVDTADQHQRKGAGKAMIEFLKELARQRGWRSLWVLTAHGDN